MKIKSVLELIGNTPLVEINKNITGLKNINLYAKCEMFNPFGSLKDRAALSMIREDIFDIKNEDKTIIESSSGNTAKALCSIANLNDIKFKTITNRIKIPETKDILKILGAEIEELPGVAECYDPTDPTDPISHIQKLVDNSNNYYFTNQYTNLKNPKIHYDTTGEEIIRDLDGKCDYFFGVLGTTGSTKGIVTKLLENNPNLKKYGIIASKNDFIPGIRNREEMYEVGIFSKDLYDDILEVDSVTAIDGMLTLNRKLGLLCGPTSGAAYIRTLQFLQELDKTLDKEINAVFVVCDRLEWYISYIKKRKPELFYDNVKTDSVKNISNEDLIYKKELLVDDFSNFVSNNNPIIIDLRGNMAYKNQHIPNSINITDSYFEDLIDLNTIFSKNSKVILVCLNGSKSDVYSAYLNKKGMDVYSLKGGILEYRNKNLVLEREMKKIIL